MKVFISWSGERSQALAFALRDWLPLVLHYSVPWLSSEDIKSGDRWGTEIAKELQETNFGIIFVTKDNLDAPWLLFESGALAKSMEDGRVIPLRLDIDVSDITGPLTQFQSEKADANGIKRLMTALNKAAPTPIGDDRLSRLFDPMWPDLREKIDAIPSSGTAPKRPRPTGDILEELVAGVRSVEMRVRDMSEDDPSFRKRSRRRIHPGMLMDISHKISDQPNDPIRILMYASLFKEDIPWLYELAAELYRSSKSGNYSEAKRAYRQFREAIEYLRRGPIFDIVGPDKYLHMAISEALEFISSVDLPPPGNSPLVIKKKPTPKTSA